MKLQLWPAALLACSLAVTACSKGTLPPPPPAPPLIKSFSADTTRLSAGQKAKLSFTVDGATSVTLTDQTGSPIATTGDASSGEAIVSPPVSTLYVLTAKGDGGLDSAFAQVGVSEGLQTVFLVAVPPTVKAGEPVSLVFSAVGGKNVGLVDAAGTAVDLKGLDHGVVSVIPSVSTSYQLSAKGDGPAPLTATAAVTVVPVISQFDAAPPAGRPGQTITLSWKTAGAQAVTVSERTFGAVPTAAADVAAGSVEWTVPTHFGLDADAGTADGGAPGGAVPLGLPLEFTLTATTAAPVQTVSRTLASIVGDGPVIADLNAPAFATAGHPMTIAWRTTAYRIELLADGLVVFAPTSGQLTTGSGLFPAPTADTVVTLVAYDFTGLSTRLSTTVKVVKPPTVTSFTLPATLGTGGTAATAAWATTDATAVTVRVKGGPAAYSTSDAARVASGMAQLFPGVTTTYALEAYNAAGDKASLEKTVEVGVPVTLSATPNPTGAGTDVTLAWDFAAQSPSDVLGVPAAAVRTGASTAFVDVSAMPTATRLKFIDGNDGVAQLDAPNGFTFPVVGKGYSTFYVSTNGFLSLSPTAALSANADLATVTASTPLVIAPFWDDLDLLTADPTEPGSVQWLVDGTTFPRRLIVQWNKVRIAGEPDSRLTFQLHLWETGAVRAVYGTLTDTSGMRAGGQQATIGLNLGVGRFNEKVSFNPTSTAAVIAGDDLSWFSGGNTSGSVSLKAFEPFAPGFFYKTSAGNLVSVSTPVRVFGPGAVVVNEVMPVTAAAVTSGQWVELFNPSSAPVDVGGLQLVASSAPTVPWLIPAGTLIAPTGYLVLGQSTDPALNGQASVNVAWGASDLPFAATDSVKLQVPLASPVDVSSQSWTAATAGTSVFKDTAVGTAGPLTCTHVKTYGQSGAVGTPGKTNESCFGEYTLSAATFAFEDVSASGTSLFTTSSLSTLLSVQTIAPFTYFGVPRTQVWVGGSGWLAFTPQASTNNTNPTVASPTRNPVGAIAPFWDYLYPVASTNVYLGRVGDHTIVQWAHTSTLASIPDDDLNFEVKLFDSGTIEFHYGTMTRNASSTTNYAAGASATVWVERPDGGAALPVSINQPTIAPNSAWRFTPAP